MPNKAKLEHKELLEKARVAAKTSKKHINAEQDGALFRYHEGLRSIRGIAKAVDERNADQADSLTHS